MFVSNISMYSKRIMVWCYLVWKTWQEPTLRMIAFLNALRMLSILGNRKKRDLERKVNECYIETIGMGNIVARIKGSL